MNPQMTFTLMTKGSKFNGVVVVDALQAVLERVTADKAARPDGGREGFFLNEVTNWEKLPEVEQLVLEPLLSTMLTRSNIMYELNRAVKYIQTGGDLQRSIREVLAEALQKQAAENHQASSSDDESEDESTDEE